MIIINIIIIDGNYNFIFIFRWNKEKRVREIFGFGYFRKVFGRVRRMKREGDYGFKGWLFVLKFIWSGINWIIRSKRKIKKEERWWVEMLGFTVFYISRWVRLSLIYIILLGFVVDCSSSWVFFDDRRRKVKRVDRIFEFRDCLY